MTEVGQLYLDRCQRVLEEAEEADVAVDAVQTKPRGMLRVGVHIAFFQLISAQALSEFLAGYPDLNLQFQSHRKDGPSRERNVDVSILGGPLEDSGFMVKSIVRIRLGIYASPDYLQNREMPGSPADLRQHSCILKCGMFGEAGDSAIWRLRCGLDAKEIRIEPRVSVPDPTLYHQLAIAGVGVALLSQALVRRDLREGRLVRVLPEWAPDPFELYAVYKSRLNSSPKVRASLRFLREHLADKNALFKTGQKRAAAGCAEAGLHPPDA